MRNSRERMCNDNLPHAPHDSSVSKDRTWCPGRPMRTDVPWNGGTVEGVAADLRHARDLGKGERGTLLLHAAAVGMIESLALGDNRPVDDRMADIQTVLNALELVQRDQGDLDTETSSSDGTS